jgi:excinuclease ABC subunit C
VKSDAIEIQLKSLPEVPGVYQYFDKQDKIIYIGKAKNVKKRVTSYFNKTGRKSQNTRSCEKH